MQHPTDTRTPAQRLTQRLTGLAPKHPFEPEALIVAEGDASAGLWLLVADNVRIYELTPDGREHVLHLFGPGNTFNDVAALDCGPIAANAAAIRPAVAWVIPTDALQWCLAMDQAPALRFIQALARRFR